MRRGKSNKVFLLVLLGATAGALGHVAVHAKRLDVGLLLGNEQHAHLALQEERRKLEVEIGRLKDPGRLVSLARDQLKMAPPVPGNLRRVGPAVNPPHTEFPHTESR